MGTNTLIKLPSQLKIALLFVCSLQNQMDGYHETSLTTKNGAHHELDNREPGAGVPGGIGVHPKDDQELFNDPSSCPRYLDCRT